MKIVHPKHRFYFLLLAGFLYILMPASLLASPAETSIRVEPPKSVLFIGNSLTFYNNAIYTHLRKLLVAEDPALRRQIFLKSMTISGGKLADHAGGLTQMLNSRPWEVVVLQGQSREAFDPELAEGFESSVEMFAQQIRSKGAEPVLFMTWAYADQPEMAEQQAQAFKRLGDKYNIMVIPVGLAFEQALKMKPSLVLHNEDRIHPSLEGTYLAAAVFYSALYQKSPLELDYDAGMAASTARLLRKAAAESVEVYFNSPAK